MKQIRIAFFSPINNAGCSCGCSCGETDLQDPEKVKGTLVMMGSAVKEMLGDNAEVTYADYASSQGIYKAVEMLNKILIRSEIKFIVTPQNFFTFISSVAPIIAINEKIYTTRGLPTQDELINHISKAEAAES